MWFYIVIISIFAFIFIFWTIPGSFIGDFSNTRDFLKYVYI